MEGIDRQVDGVAKSAFRMIQSTSAPFPLASMSEIAQALAGILSRVQARAGTRAVRLVAVSKTKPPEDLMEAYVAGQRHFGENYVRPFLSLFLLIFLSLLTILLFRSLNCRKRASKCLTT